MNIHKKLDSLKGQVIEGMGGFSKAGGFQVGQFIVAAYFRKFEKTLGDFEGSHHALEEVLNYLFGIIQRKITTIRRLYTLFG